MLSDCEIDVIAAQKGDKDAFVRLIRIVEQSMYRVARSILKSDEACADAIQETILKAYRSMGSLNQPGFFRTWLIRILINECNRMLKSSRRVILLETIGKQPTAEPAYESVEIQEAVDSLDDEFRVVVTLYYFEELSVKEISKALALPEGTVKSRLNRARAKLAHVLSGDEGRLQGGHRQL